MKNSIPCPRCSRTVAANADGQLPPWCTECGADLKADRRPVPPPLQPARPDESVSARPLKSGPIPLRGGDDLVRWDRDPVLFFHACEPAIVSSNCLMYRLYVTASDCLVFRLGRGDFSFGQVVPPPRPTPLLFHRGAIAALAIHRQQEKERRQLEERLKYLDAADEDALRGYAKARWDESFLAGPRDMRSITIDPPSLWYRFGCGVAHEGVLKFWHRTEGEMSMALPTAGDARRAVEGMTRLFGNEVEVNLRWGSGARRAGREE
jgi:hypothetical protein